MLGQIIFRGKALNFFKQIVYFSGILPKFGKLLLSLLIVYMKQYLCEATMFCISSDNSFAFNQKLNESLFCKDKIDSNRMA